MSYFAWAVGERMKGAHTSCPSCAETGPTQIDSKYVVTALFECPECKLRFRVPKESAASSVKFYQRTYKQGFATGMPAPAELAKLLKTKFVGSERDFSTYIAVCRAA